MHMYGIYMDSFSSILIALLQQKKNVETASTTQNLHVKMTTQAGGMSCFGQNSVDRSCSVIWSTVGVVCLTWSSGVDKACLSQYFDSLFAYALLGCFEMLSSGRSIFHCPS